MAAWRSSLICCWVWGSSSAEDARNCFWGLSASLIGGGAVAASAFNISFGEAGLWFVVLTLRGRVSYSGRLHGVENS